MIKLCKIVTEPLLKMEFWMVGLVVCLWSIEAAVHYGASWLGSEKVKMVKWRLTQFKPSFLSTSEPFEKRAYFQQNVWTFDK